MKVFAQFSGGHSDRWVMAVFSSKESAERAWRESLSDYEKITFPDQEPDVEEFTVDK